MRKYIFGTLLLLLVLLVTSCGRSTNDIGDPPQETEPGYEYQGQEQGQEHDPEEELSTVGNLPTQGIPLTALTTEHFLADLDYMLYVLENNFALFDVAYWARGVDIYAIVESTRTAVMADPYMDALEFFDLVARKFQPLYNVGHFGVMPTWLHSHINSRRSLTWEYYLFTRSARQRLFQPHVLELYSALDDRPPLPHDERLSNMFTELTEQEVHLLLRHMLYALRTHGYDCLADDLWQAAIAANGVEIARLLSYTSEQLANYPNIRKEILEEGKIAYVAVDSFMTDVPLQAFLNFYYQIRDYEHLIIDLRLNSGGAPAWFHTAFVAPNISQEVTIEGFAFVAYGDYSSEYANFTRGRPLFPAGGMPIVADSHTYTIAAFLGTYDLPKLNLADMERMDYVFRISTTIRPNLTSRFDNQPAFTGKIWLLTGPLMASGTQHSAWVAQDINFATLVGDITGGHYGGARTYVVLPNSGLVMDMDLFYLTDRLGRAIEAGTTPDYFSREGMDALETVLAIIAEGSY